MTGMLTGKNQVATHTPFSLQSKALHGYSFLPWNHLPVFQSLLLNILKVYHLGMLAVRPQTGVMLLSVFHQTAFAEGKTCVRSRLTVSQALIPSCSTALRTLKCL